MNRKTMLVLGLIAFFGGGYIVYTIAQAFQNYNLTETAIVLEDGLHSKIELKGVGETDWTEILETDAIDWDVVAPGTEYVYDVKITNVGTIIFLVTFTTNVDTKYPGWTETLSIDGESVLSGTAIIGTLTLSVPTEADLGETYAWTSMIECIEVPS